MGDILTVLAHITQDLLGTLHGLIVTVFASKRIQDRIRILQVKTLGKLNDSMHMGLARLVRLFSNHSPKSFASQRATILAMRSSLDTSF